VETSFTEVKKGLEEKLAFVEDAKRKLADTFSALSGEALKSNNQAFVEFAKGHLEKYQEAARGDLEKRQGAIAQMVTPVQEVLKSSMKNSRGWRTRAWALTVNSRSRCAACSIRRSSCVRRPVTW
jgi:hypothetical protein